MERSSEWLEDAGAVREELLEWRRAHPRATIDEIVTQVTRRRRQLMGQLVGEIIGETQIEEREMRYCPECRETMEYHGKTKRCISHYEGDTDIERDYYYCPHCKEGLSPPG